MQAINYKKSTSTHIHIPCPLIVPEHRVVHSHVDAWSLVVKGDHLTSHAPEDKWVIVGRVESLARRVHAGNLRQVVRHKVVVLEVEI